MGTPTDPGVLRIGRGPEVTGMAQIHQQLPDDWVEGVGIVGIILLVGGSSYLRGRLDASPMSAGDWAAHVAAEGPYWPAALTLVGFILLGAATLTMIKHETS